MSWSLIVLKPNPILQDIRVKFVILHIGHSEFKKWHVLVKTNFIPQYITKYKLQNWVELLQFTKTRQLSLISSSHLLELSCGQRFCLYTFSAQEMEVSPIFQTSKNFSIDVVDVRLSIATWCLYDPIMVSASFEDLEGWHLVFEVLAHNTLVDPHCNHLANLLYNVAK